MTTICDKCKKDATTAQSMNKVTVQGDEELFNKTLDLCGDCIREFDTWVTGGKA